MISYDVARIAFRIILAVLFVLNGWGWYFGDVDMQDKNDMKEKLLRKLVGIGWFIIALLV